MITTKDGDAEKQEIQGFAIGNRILFREKNPENGGDEWQFRDIAISQR